MRVVVEEVKAGSKLSKTAENLGVPVITFHDHIKKGSEYKPRLGGKLFFSTEQESKIGVC